MVCLVLLLALNSIEIVIRYFFDSSNIWSQEVSLLLVCGTIFFGFAKIVIDQEDIAISFLVNFLTEKGRYTAEILVNALLAFTAGYMFYHTILLMRIQSGQKTLLAEIPYFYYSFPLAIVLMVVLLQGIVQTVYLFQQRRKLV